MVFSLLNNYCIFGKPDWLTNLNESYETQNSI